MYKSVLLSDISKQLMRGAAQLAHNNDTGIWFPPSFAFFSLSQQTARMTNIAVPAALTVNCHFFPLSHFLYSDGWHQHTTPQMPPEFEAQNQRHWGWTPSTGTIYEVAEGWRHTQLPRELWRGGLLCGWPSSIKGKLLLWGDNSGHRGKGDHCRGPGA